MAIWQYAASETGPSFLVDLFSCVAIGEHVKNNSSITWLLVEQPTNLFFPTNLSDVRSVVTIKVNHDVQLHDGIKWLQLDN